MYEFKWHVPRPSSVEGTLCLHAGSGWLARKRLTCDGQTIYQRGYFTGIETRFAPHPGRPELHLRIVPVANSTDWRPALFAGDAEIPEATGTAPPRIVPPPQSLAIPVGLTYLLMAIAAAMLPQTTTILDAAYLHYDDRRIVLQVRDPNADEQALAVDTTDIASATVGQRYTTTFRATGGTPPYRWARAMTAWPHGWELDPATGTLAGTPADAHDLLFRVTLTDAAKQRVEWPVALVVDPATPPVGTRPVIRTQALLPATVGQAYEVTFEHTGGKTPLTWKTLGKRKPPAGIKLDAGSGVVSGTPEEAGLFPLTVRVYDDAYHCGDDIQRWVAPFLVPAGCLLGFLAMRRWSVWTYAVLIAAQLGGNALGILPVAPVALGMQLVLWLVGLVHISKMR